MPKSPEQVSALLDALAENDYTTKPYSGRGMYGKRCVSVSGGGGDTERPSAWDIAKYLSSEVYDGEFDSLPEPRQDSLGLGIVLYWPSYEWPEEEE